MLHCIQNVTLPNMFHLAKERHFAKNLTALFGEVTRTASKKGFLRNVNSKNKSLRKISHFENDSLRYFHHPLNLQKMRHFVKKRHFAKKASLRSEKLEKSVQESCTFLAKWHFLSKWRVWVTLMWQIDAFEIQHFKNG